MLGLEGNAGDEEGSTQQAWEDVQVVVAEECSCRVGARGVVNEHVERATGHFTDLLRGVLRLKSMMS